MMFFNEIREAIWELSALNCRREDLIIAYSPLVERFIIQEVHESRMLLTNVGEFKTFEGISIYNLHPYNEIVVYDSKNSSYHPQLLKKIEVKMIDRKIYVKQNQEKT